MNKQRIKTTIIICMIFIMLVTLTACTSKEAKSVIKKIDSIGEVTENSGELLTKIQSEYTALTDEQKAEVDNYDQYTEAKKDFDILIYSSIKREVEKAQTLENRYFSKYYDLNDFNKAKAAAKEALEKSNVDTYSDVFFDLKNQNDGLASYIDSEIKKLYNVQTDENGKYPFAVNIDLTAIEWDAEPIRKQNSKHPTWIICSEPDTTDEKPKAIIFTGDECTGECAFENINVAEKEILIENDKGDIERAIVNTQINFKEVGYGAISDLNERPAYLLKNKNGETILALQNYEGKDYFVLYNLCETSFE